MNRAGPAPAVIVRGARDVAAALSPGWPLTLLSAPGAAAFAGPLWWAALARHARASGPGLVALDILDAGAAPGTALAAFRCGCRTVALDPGCPAWRGVEAVAREIGASLLGVLPPALDIGEPGAARRLDAWLAGDAGHPDDTGLDVG